MKKAIFVTLLIIFCQKIFGQDFKIDSLVIRYINAKKEFVSLADTTNLPALIKPYYNCILEYLFEKKLNKDFYYVSVDCVKDQTDTILIPMYHYNGFKKLSELENKDKELNMNRSKGESHFTSSLDGNASGLDGNLKIDKKKKKVIGFIFWQ